MREKRKRQQHVAKFLTHLYISLTACLETSTAILPVSESIILIASGLSPATGSPFMENPLKACIAIAPALFCGI